MTPGENVTGSEFNDLVFVDMINEPRLIVGSDPEFIDGPNAADTLRVDVQCEDLLTARRVQTSTAYLTFVAIDKKGRPVPVPPLLLETEHERREARAAEARRAERLKKAHHAERESTRR